MTTPAGWYDDGSGRQRWWDGTQWTEHFAPATETAAVPEATPYSAPPVTPSPTAPAPVSVIGLVGLGLAVLGTILACIPAIPFVGWILLIAGFVVSLVSLFLKGRKWPGITGLIVSVVGGIISVIVSVVMLAVSTYGAITENMPSDFPSYSAPSDEGTGVPSDSLGRPTVDEVKTALTKIIEQPGSTGLFDDAQLTCISQGVVDSDIDDATLREIANGTFADTSGPAAEKFGTVL